MPHVGARLALAQVHEELVLEGAAHTVHVTEVVDARPARVDARAQRRDHAVAQALILLARQPPGRPSRVHPRPEQRLIRVDVAHAGDPALVQQERLDRRRPALRQRPQVLRREALVERLEAEPRREERLERVAAQQQLARAEAARVDDRQAHAVATFAPARRTQLHAHAHVLLLGVRVSEHRARHAQVLRQVHVAVEAPHQVLAAPAQALDAPAAQRLLELVRRERARPARVEDLDPRQPAALDQRRELAL